MTDSAVERLVALIPYRAGVQCRVRNALHVLKVKTEDDLRALTRDNLRPLKNFGQHSQSALLRARAQMFSVVAPDDTEAFVEVWLTKRYIGLGPRHRHSSWLIEKCARERCHRPRPQSARAGMRRYCSKRCLKRDQNDKAIALRKADGLCIWGSCRNPGEDYSPPFTGRRVMCREHRLRFNALQNARNAARA